MGPFGGPRGPPPPGGGGPLGPFGGPLGPPPPGGGGGPLGPPPPGGLFPPGGPPLDDEELELGPLSMVEPSFLPSGSISEIISSRGSIPNESRNLVSIIGSTICSSLMSPLKGLQCFTDTCLV